MEQSHRQCAGGQAEQRQAGVPYGVRTPALLQALVVQRLTRVAADAREHAASPDVGAAFFDFFAAVVRGSATKLELVDLLTELGVHPDQAVAPVADELTEALAALLRKAQQAGAVREDVQVRDVIALLAGASQARRHAPDDRPLTVILDGLRHPGAP